ncbi:MAG: AIR synthase-related protein, partial [Microvirga sp.]
IGDVTDTGELRAFFDGDTVGEIPAVLLTDECPRYEVDQLAAARPAAPVDPVNAEPKDWIYEQYDQLVLSRTVRRPGLDAAVLRLRPSWRGLAVSLDGPPLGERDPFAAGMQAVLDAARNVACAGGEPLALTDCLNFGNPEKPEIGWELTQAIEGIAQAAEALGVPVVSGNVSLYNETNGRGILPTPTIGGVGVLADCRRHASVAFKREGDAILLVGETRGWLGQSVYLREVLGREEGAPPPVDLEAERKNGDFVRHLIEARLVDTVHDCSDGGVAVAVAEMAMAGGVGAVMPECPVDLPCHAYLFGEDQARYVLAVDPDTAPDILYSAASKGIPVAIIGMTGADSLTLPGEDAISIAELRQAHEGWLPAYMAAQPA